MARIIQEIKKRYNVCDLLLDETILREDGNMFSGECPLCHSEFLVAHRQENIYHCFGCSSGGGPDQFLMEINGINIEGLASYVPELFDQVSLESAERKTLKYYQIYEHATSYFESHLGEKQLEYLEQRGITRASIGEFSIGYADSKGGCIEYLLSLGFTKSDLSFVGLVNSYGYPTFQNRIVFPIRDSSGLVVAFSGRACDDGIPKYLNSPRTKLYDKSRILFGAPRGSGYILPHVVWIVEGQFDTVALRQATGAAVFGTSGTAFSHHHYQSLLADGFTEFRLLFDNDTAGQGAISRVAEIMGFDGLYIATLPHSKDPAEYFQLGGTVSEITITPYLEYEKEKNTSSNSTSIPQSKMTGEGVPPMEEGSISSKG